MEKRIMTKSTTRVNALRDKRRASGLVRLEIYIKPEWRELIINFVESLKKT